ncbi:hypothetical protein N7G274_004017 [Stereocaulon virgatum]|uniref:Uncharacterized protein n=1 Tax=Stereocaulon virgatum TaxID=373712 RepID=A0ABR4AAQ7_9LECA
MLGFSRVVDYKPTRWHVWRSGWARKTIARIREQQASRPLVLRNKGRCRRNIDERFEQRAESMQHAACVPTTACCFGCNIMVASLTGIGIATSRLKVSGHCG